MAAAIEAEHHEVSQRNLRTLTMELIIALVIVLLFFSVVLGIINLFLPIGTSVKELAYSIRESVSSTQQETSIAEGEEGLAPGTYHAVSAKVSYIANRVNVKSANDIAWSAARVGMSLFDRDALQTYSEARALIEFDEENYLDLGENSLVVFQGMERNMFTPKARTLRLVVEGSLRGRLVASQEGATNLQVALPGGDLQMLPGQGAEGDVEFELDVNQDQSSTLAVKKGSAQLLMGGKAIQLPQNHGLMIDAEGNPLEPIELPPPPIPKSPHDGSAIYFRDLAPKVTFSWERAESATSYRFMLARDPYFRQLVVDERLKRTRFKYGNLKQGPYYWRVHARVNRLEGPPSKPQALGLVRDRKPPLLNVLPPPKVVHRNTVVLRGKTEPGTKVYVEGKRVKTGSDGTFQHRLRIKPGASLIVVEAIDPAGNVAYATSLVNGKF
ncbi:MAG: hypothetical protein ACE5LB_03285 [Acidiferrobacterales bacterium]